jgi:gliding motility-associated-like protein
MRTWLKQIVLPVILLIAHGSYAQLTTNNSKSPEQLVREVLAGDGVEISNVTFSGQAKQRGEFAGISNIGLSSGLILSTGTVLDEVDNGNGRKLGPVGPNNNNGASSIRHTPDAHDADLAQLAGRPLNQTLDAVVLEFDFIPEGDSIAFRYVFASEEYPDDFISGNQEINDVFGFFINGPGIAGKKNIAVLSDGVTEVSATTVNPNTNSNLYISNGNGLPGDPQFTNQMVVNYDGFTRVLTARAKVTPCQTYHLKIAVCDIQDKSFDTGVFLEANSLSSAPSYSFRKSADFSPLGVDTILPEGCANGELIIERTENLNTSLKVGFSVGGSATEGVDYTLSTINDTVTFNPGETSKTVSINTIRDALSEGNETVILTFANPSVCAASATVAFTYIIRDQPKINTSSGTYAINCPGQTIDIRANVTGGVPGFDFNWDHTGSNNQTVGVSPNVTTKYYYTALDTCGNLSNRDSITVTVPTYLPLSVTSTPDFNVRCKGTLVNLSANANGGAGGYVYNWSNGDNGSAISDELMQTTDFRVTVTDQCSSTATATTRVTLNAPELIADAGFDQQICVGDTVHLSGMATGGVPRVNGTYTYFWGGTLGQNRSVIIRETRDFILTVTDSCGLVPAKDTVTVTAVQPQANFYLSVSIPEPDQPIELIDLSEDAIDGFWLTNDNQRVDGLSGVISFEQPGTYEITQIVEDIQGCRDTLKQQIVIRPPVYYYLPNAFTPNGDGQNDIFVGKGKGVTEFSMVIYDRWGLQVFSTNDWTEGWDGNGPSGNPMPTGTYVVKYTAKGDSEREYDYMVTVHLIRY